ncbi:DUF1800 domain-containing protein [Enterovibrio paralichthyis]|uniref:DUF1800 domain-containing protein n=1 Tax=Enterovibrio paralichthyis TaxID=2853805 RepID=UPI001C44A05C|nr:DUF1800 domain-containing protein [Enterovibrio paralichthyis]MBV7300114.1 DUF1800 domain-containing protein [Enterovibrio paralichthyis]
MNKIPLLATLMLPLLLGCNGKSEIPSVTVPNLPSWLPDNAPAYLSEQQQHSFIERATAGNSASLSADLNRMGYINWMEQQFNLPVTSQRKMLEAALPTIESMAPPSNCWFVRPNSTTARDGIWWDQMLYGQDQLRQRAAFALSQILVVSRRFAYIGRYPQSLAAYYDILQQHAFGNYRDLLEAVTLSPAMGSYLSMVNSKKHNPKRGTYPDENYAREVMQLFTIGLYELNTDGTPKLDSQGNKIQTYTQGDVEEIARAFSGWTYSDRVIDPETNRPVDGKGLIQPMMPGSDKWGSWHDDGEKTVFGHTLPAGQTPLKDVQDVLDILFEHPNTGPFVARHLIQRLVTSNPSPAYIERVAQAFNDNGQGIRGDMESVFAAIWLDDEALNGSSNPERYPVAKLKEPILAVAEVFRILNAKTYGGKDALPLDTNEIFHSIAQGPLAATSVFNFYSPEFSPSGPLSDSGLKAPEFEIMPWAGFISYQNALRPRFSRVYKPDTVRCDNAIYLDLSAYFTAAQSADENALPDLINARFLDGAMSNTLRVAMMNAIASERIYQNKAAIALTLVVTSPEFLIQR